ncbi:MAG TPA: hydrogenase maturation protease [Micromonosporaceae bacterium]|jgi:hydrogenase maturation protease|nr:hydrogenase maturation protease [Micromonosporaceae bacterium]
MNGIIVIGVGNPFRRDDGLGPAVITRLRARDLPGATLATSLGETGDLIDLWDGAELALVVDAIRSSPAHPGRVHRLTVGQLSGERARAASSHGMDLGEAVELARELGRLPVRLVLYAVEAGDVGFGLDLTPAVERAVAHLADEITTVVWATQRTRRAQVA